MLQRKALTKRKKKTRRKKPEKWLEVKQEIRPKFIEAGITTCELYNVEEFLVAIKEQLDRKQNCKHFLFPTFAHSLRRRKIDKFTGAERAKLLREVIRACSDCHKLLDSLNHDTTTELVRLVIERRPRKIV